MMSEGDNTKKYEDITTAAQEYTARGWVVHPLSSPKNKGKSPGKRPLLTGWQKRDRPATEAELDKWFKNMDNNICLVCGKASGVDAFDLDTDIFADELYGDTEPNTLISGHRPGRCHVLFQHEADLIAEKCHFIGIEYFGNSKDGNGNNIVLPPSIH